jgi:hypothetical protein
MTEGKPMAFDLRELATALIRQRGLHEGKWVVGFEFNMAGINIGGENEEKPAAVVQINKALLLPFAGHLPKWMAVDAAEVNPPTKKKSA